MEQDFNGYYTVDEVTTIIKPTGGIQMSKLFSNLHPTFLIYKIIVLGVCEPLLRALSRFFFLKYE